MPYYNTKTDTVPRLQTTDIRSEATRQLMQRRRAMRTDKLTSAEGLEGTNRHISKSIRRDIRIFKKNKIQQTMENKGMAVLRRRLDIEKRQIIKIIKTR